MPTKVVRKSLSELRDQDWRVNATLHDDGHYTVETDTLVLFLLADIRAELQQLNRTFGCTNFLAMPAALQEIAREARAQRRERLARAKEKK